jgi:hypothetical protein
MPKPTLSAVSTAPLPDPPYPPDTKAGSFAFDVDIARIVASDTWILAKPEVRPWLLSVWALSWLQVPCGTWPKEIELISAHVGCSPDFFRLHESVLLRGWELYSDGRRYHPVITEKVTKMCAARENWRWKRKKKGNKNVSGDTLETPSSVSGDSPGSLPPSYSYSSSSSSSCSKSTSVETESMEGDCKGGTVLKKKSEKKKNAPPQKIPLDWQPSESSMRWLAEHGITDPKQIAAIVNDFRAYWIENGGRRAKWDAAFLKNPVVKSQIQKFRNAGRTSNGGYQQYANSSDRAATARAALDAEREARGFFAVVPG